MIERLWERILMLFGKRYRVFCGSCRYFDEGACRRRPPQRVYTGAPPDGVDASVWPTVRATMDWCGEHEA